MPAIQAAEKLYDRTAFLYDVSMWVAGYPHVLKHAIRESDISDVVKAADIGCGTGLSTRILKKHVPNAEVVGMDMSTNMLAKYQIRHPSAPVYKGDFNNPATIEPINSNRKIFENGPYDLVIAAASISEYGNQNAFDLTYQLLAPGGRLLVIGMRNNWLSRLSGLPWGYRAPGLESATETCLACGYKEVTEIPMSWKSPFLKYHKFIMTAKKEPNNS